MGDYTDADEVRTQSDKIQTTGSSTTAALDILIAAAEEAINRLMNRPDGFVADAAASAREFPGSGNAIQLIDENVEITLVEVKDSPTDTAADYVSWATTDWIAFKGDPEWPDFNGLPQDSLMVDPSGDESLFTSGRLVGRAGFRPIEPQVSRRAPTVRITAKWGFSVIVPDIIKQAAIAQTTQWWMRGQGSWADTLASGELGQLQFRMRGAKLDPDIAIMLEGSRFTKPAIGRA